MINAAITGGETIAAGELIRILINHPDVNLRAVASDTAAGRVLTEVHRGLEGDTSLEFTPALDEETIRKTNMVFLCGEPWQAEQFIERLPDFESKCNDESLRIIDLTGRYRNGNNDGKYSSAVFDGALADARATTDPAERFAALHKAEDAAMNDAAMIPVAYYADFWLQSPSLQGVWHSAYGYWYLQYAHVA